VFGAVQTENGDTENMKLLDCFCGMGGVSDGFALEGFDVTGIDIVDAPKMLGYKHKFIQADMKELWGYNYQGYDVIWGSPPCRDFSQMAHVGYGSKRTDTKGKWAWKIPPNPENGLKLVRAYLDFVHKASPHFWIMENVPNLASLLDCKPRQTSRIAPTKKRAFWGNFPNFLMPMQEMPNVAKNVRGRIYCVQGKNRSWKRAMIPLACSRAIAKACKDALMEEVKV
jgi:DNA (cytosine-5)-methyltransferase 1